MIEPSDGSVARWTTDVRWRWSAAVVAGVLGLVAIAWLSWVATARLLSEGSAEPATVGRLQSEVPAVALGSSGGDDVASADGEATDDAPRPPEPSGEALAPFRILLVVPGPADDTAFSQSMVDAVRSVVVGRENAILTIEDEIEGPEAATLIEQHVGQGYDLIVAHGSQYLGTVERIAAANPSVTFVTGTTSDRPNLVNLYTYTVAAEEGGYVLGALAARLSPEGVIGGIGPVEVGVSQRYLQGFAAGAEAERPGTAVLVGYTGSFVDGEAAAALARSHIGSGAQVLTGNGHRLGSAVAEAVAAEVVWLGNQVDQAPLGPEAVVASQVYRWEVLIDEVLADIDADADGGRSLEATLANGGIEIVYNPLRTLAPVDLARVDALIDGIVRGEIDP